MASAADLNSDYQSATINRAALEAALRAEGEDFFQAVVTERPHLFSDTAFFISAAQMTQMQAIIAAVMQVAALPAWVAAAPLPAGIHSAPQSQGVFFGYDIPKRVIVLADRGRGVRTTLQQIRPELSDDMEALRVAFTEVLSGRSPEKRGNGLKVVRSIAESSSIGLLFRSGIGKAIIPKHLGKIRIEITDENISGTYAVITY